MISNGTLCCFFDFKTCNSHADILSKNIHSQRTTTLKFSINAKFSFFPRAPPNRRFPHPVRSPASSSLTMISFQLFSRFQMSQTLVHVYGGYGFKPGTHKWAQLKVIGGRGQIYCLSHNDCWSAEFKSTENHIRILSQNYAKNNQKINISTMTKSANSNMNFCFGLSTSKSKSEKSSSVKLWSGKHSGVNKFERFHYIM